MDAPWGYCMFCGIAVSTSPMPDGCVHCPNCGRYGRPVVNPTAVTACFDPPIDPTAGPEAVAGLDSPNSSAQTFLIEGEEVAIPGHEILEELGRGGMGSVYRARQLKTGRFVAVKVLSQKLASKESFVLRFQREARAQALAAHPNVVEVYEHGEHAGLFYFTMEFVEGVSLRHWIRDGEFSGREFFSLASQICRAVDHIHGQRLIHRDLKPENILIDRTRTVKVGDFGLVDLVCTDGQEANLTRTRSILGTLNYMAPEQALDSSRVTNQVDIYSLGVVFYELLTGKVPLGRYDSPSLLNAQIDARLDEPILKALEVEPKKRYVTVASLASKFDELAGSLTSDQLDRPWGPTSAARERERLEQGQVERGERLYRDMMASREGPEPSSAPPSDGSRTAVREAQFMGVWRSEREKRRARQDDDDQLTPEEQRMESKLQALHLQKHRRKKPDEPAPAVAGVTSGSAGILWSIVGVVLLLAALVAGWFLFTGG